MHQRRRRVTNERIDFSLLLFLKLLPKHHQLFLFPLWFFYLSFSLLSKHFCFLLLLLPWRSPPPFCPWSAVQCYCQLWLRTEEGHHLVTIRLSQIPPQGHLATTVVAFGIPGEHVLTQSVTQKPGRESFFVKIS